jgi:hypothetical protein
LAYTKYLGAQEAGKELLLYGVGDDALALLKKQYINFSNATIQPMILHLCEKTAIKMTTSQKFEYKAKGYGKQWDLTTSITVFHPPQKVSNLFCQPWYRNKYQGNDDGCKREKVGEQDFHQGPNGCMGEQDRCAANLAEYPRLLCRKNG